MKKLIILDRDGVINIESDAYIKSPNEWIPIPGSLEAIAQLNQLDYTIAVATNQSGIGRKLYTDAIAQAIFNKMYEMLEACEGKIDYLAYCPHLPTDHCDCRKPKPGLLNQIAAHYQQSLAHVPFIGDSWTDVQAALDIGAQPILVLTGKGQQTYNQNQTQIRQYNIPVYTDLLSYVRTL